MSAVPEGGNEEESDEGSIDGSTAEKIWPKKSENGFIDSKTFESRVDAAYPGRYFRSPNKLHGIMV